MKHTHLFRTVAVLLLTLLACPMGAEAAELVTTPNDPAAWKLELQSDATATMRQDQGAIRVDIVRNGSDNWHVQIYQVGKTLRDGAVCTLRFTAKASTRHAVRINSQTSVSPWRMVLVNMPTFDLTPEWTEYSAELAVRDTNNESLRMPMFLLGDAAGTVWFKDVSVIGPGGSSTAAPPQPSMASIIPPPTAPPAAPASNLLSAPMDPASWRFEAIDSARGTLRAENGMLRIDVDAPSREAWHIQMFQTPASLAAGRPYILTINVRSTTPRKLLFTAQQDAAPNELLLPSTGLNIGPEWKMYKLRFTLKKAVPGQTRTPLLQMGDAAGTVFIRAISLTEAGDSTTPAK